MYINESTYSTLMEVFERVQAIAEGALRGVFIFAGLEKEVFSKRLAYYFLEINALHPFHDGNVTQRHQQKAA